MANERDFDYWFSRYAEDIGPRHFEGLKNCPKVKDTKWAGAPKPYLPLPFKAQLTSSEIHWIYETTKAQGKGNFAHLGVAWGASVWINHIACPDSIIYAVDLWSDYVLNQDKNKLIELCKNVITCEGSTEQWGKDLNVPFKFVFIDADHSYNFVKQDWELWSPKVEVGGVVGFHDSDMDGVRRVCNEIREGWQEIEGMHSIRAFRKQ